MGGPVNRNIPPFFYKGCKKFYKACKNFYTPCKISYSYLFLSYGQLIDSPDCENMVEISRKNLNQEKFHF